MLLDLYSVQDPCFHIFNRILIFCFIWILNIWLNFINNTIIIIILVFIKLSNAFVFSDPEPPIINSLFVSSGICGQLVLSFFMFSLVISSKLIVFVLFYYTVTLCCYISINKCFYQIDWFYSFIIVSP